MVSITTENVHAPGRINASGVAVSGGGAHTLLQASVLNFLLVSLLVALRKQLAVGVE